MLSHHSRLLASVLAILLTFTLAPSLYADSPPNLTSDIQWDEEAGTAGLQTNYVDVADIEGAYNNGRQEEVQLGLTTGTLGNLTLPDQTTWDSYSDSQKAFYLINAEREARAGVQSGVIGLPLEGIEEYISTLAQTIYISEVYEANGGSVKYVELYNPTASAINLDDAAADMVLRRYTNAGTTASATVDLTGTIPANGFYVVGDPSVDTIFGSGTLDQQSTNVNHNGNDKYDLYDNTAATVIDGFATDNVGNADIFAADVVAYRIAAALPNDGDWGSTSQPTDGNDSTSGYWRVFNITANNANALDVATPGTSSGLEAPSVPTPPTVITLSPADDATNVAVGSNLVATFNENVQLNSGTITLKKSDNSVVETFDVASSSQVSVNGAMVTIDPTAELDPNTGYYVEIAAGAIQDLDGNDFAGISGDSTWNFVTAGANSPAEATANLTVQSGGPRTGSSGLAFLNIEGSSYGSFASWGPLEFPTTGFTCGTNDELSSLMLTLTQSNAAFTTNGQIAIFVTEDTSTSLAQSNTALTFQASALPYGLDTQLDPKTLLGVVDFTQVSTGAQDTYDLTTLPGFFAVESYLVSRIANNLPVRLILAPNDATVAATWAGYTNSTYDGPTLSLSCSSDVIPNFLINEVEADSPGTDVAEFVELYDGGVGNSALDGLTLVLYNGNGDVSYNAFDLDGKSTDADGYFVLCGNAANVNNCDLAVNVSQDLIQNGADAVALYQGDATAFPNGTAVTTANLVDALVYDTSDADDSGLLVLLNVGQPQVDENANGASGDESNQRCPNGAGGQRNTNTFGQYAPTPGAANTCPAAPPATTVKLYEIQGSGTASSYDGQTVDTSGIVVADFQGSTQMNGFFLQDPTGDGNPATSDGIFVYAPGGTDVNVGDIISITAQVDEFNTLTELKNVTSLTIQSSGNALPAPAQVTLPESTDGDLEQYEGMYVQITDASNMVVAQNYFLGRYGQLTLSAGQRIYQPTNQELPGSAAATALAADNAKRLLILDDGQDINSLGDNPNPVPYIGPPPPDVIRGGDKVSNLIGVLDFGRINSDASPARNYRLQPTVAPVFTTMNARTNTPEAVGGSLKVASLNVLNYFNGNGQGGGFPTSRGADTASEFTRQRDKIIAALAAIDADVVGLLEIENDGYGPNSAIQDLVNGLNDALGAGTYAFIDPGVSPLGTDEIAVAFIYKPSTVTPVGAVAILDSSVDPDFIDTKNRPALAQTFRENSSGALFTPVINHLKSKGSDCNDVGDPEDPNGQGNCNVTRTKAATALANWLATDPTGSGDPDFLIIGDLNSYAKEDPITALKNAGYTDLINQFIGDSAYSYTFDGLIGYLDHALATASLTAQVTDVTEWHINTDEPAVIDYDEDFNPAGYYSATPFRASDHDPVIVGLNLTTAATDGTLTVTKVVINDDGGTAQVSDYTLTINDGSDPQTVTSGEANTVAAGTYQISESGPSGYTATFSGDCDSSGQVTVGAGETKSCTITNDDNPPASTAVVYISSDKNGRIGTLRFRDEDILAFDTTTFSWSMYFDGSDVGVANADLDAFQILNDGSILMSFDKPMRMQLSDGPHVVDDSDIVRFAPIQTGDNTIGTFEFVLSGAALDLKSNSEDIDAIGVDAAGNLVISTIGTLKAGGLVAADEDLITIENGTNALSLLFDGSDVGLTTGNEDITGLFIQGNKLYLTTKGSFRAQGSNSVRGNAYDILVCDLLASGEDTQCLFSAFVNLNFYGLRDGIDGMSLGAAGAQGARSIDARNGQVQVVEEDVAQFEVLEEGADTEIDPEMDVYDLPVEELDQSIFLPFVTH